MYNLACHCEERLKCKAPNVLHSSRANAGSESVETAQVRFEGKYEISELKGIDIDGISKELHWWKIWSTNNKKITCQIHVPTWQL